MKNKQNGEHGLTKYPVNWPSNRMKYDCQLETKKTRKHVIKSFLLYLWSQFKQNYIQSFCQLHLSLRHKAFVWTAFWSVVRKHKMCISLCGLANRGVSFLQSHLLRGVTAFSPTEDNKSCLCLCVSAGVFLCEWVKKKRK